MISNGPDPVEPAHLMAAMSMRHPHIPQHGAQKVDVVGRPTQAHLNEPDQLDKLGELNIAKGYIVDPDEAEKSDEKNDDKHVVEAKRPNRCLRWLCLSLASGVLLITAGIVGLVFFPMLYGADTDSERDGLDATSGPVGTLSGVIALSISGAKPGADRSGPQMFLEDEASSRAVAQSVSRALWRWHVRGLSVTLSTEMPQIPSARRLATAAAEGGDNEGREFLAKRQPEQRPRRLEASLVYAIYEVDLALDSPTSVREAANTLSSTRLPRWETMLNEELGKAHSEFSVDVLAAASSTSSTDQDGRNDRGSGRRGGRGRHGHHHDGHDRPEQGGKDGTEDLCQMLFGTDEASCGLAGTSTCIWMSLSQDLSACVTAALQGSVLGDHTHAVATSADSSIAQHDDAHQYNEGHHHNSDDEDDNDEEHDEENEEEHEDNEDEDDQPSHEDQHDNHNHDHDHDHDHNHEALGNRDSQGPWDDIEDHEDHDSHQSDHDNVVGDDNEQDEEDEGDGDEDDEDDQDEKDDDDQDDQDEEDEDDQEGQEDHDDDDRRDEDHRDRDEEGDHHH